MRTTHLSLYFPGWFFKLNSSHFLIKFASGKVTFTIVHLIVKCLWTQCTFWITLYLPQSQNSGINWWPTMLSKFRTLLKIILCAMLMNPMYLLNHLIPSSDPKQWDKLMAHNVVRVSYAVQNYFVCYAYEPNVPFESPYSFLRAKTVG